MITFDQILPLVSETLNEHENTIAELQWMLINRDLVGRVRLVVPEWVESSDKVRKGIEDIYQKLSVRLDSHAYSESTGVLYEVDLNDACIGTSRYLFSNFSNVYVADRLATESQWETISEVSLSVPRIVFFSIKGGVGRSTALAASAWWLARQGKRVLIMDLDLESPGLSSALLSSERQPKYGITDWLVEDLVENGDSIFNDIIATSDLPTSGQIYVIPAHGKEPGEYVSKLGRVWLPKVGPNGNNETWPSRLNRLISRLESSIQPDVVLVDSRAGIDEVAAACVTDLGAHTVLMFSIQGQQTWTGYRAIFSHWQQRGVIIDIRSRLQLVAGLVPDDDRKFEYLSALRSDSYFLFEDTYDRVEAGEISEWNFEEDDENAPHAPLPIRWNRGWYGLLSLQNRMVNVDESEVNAVYGALLDFIHRALLREKVR